MGIALALAMVFVFWNGVLIHNRKEVIVPDISGKSTSHALQALSELNLAVKIGGTEFNESVPIGTVLRQIPAAGSTVREGKIEVLRSTGAPDVATGRAA